MLCSIRALFIVLLSAPMGSAPVRSFAADRSTYLSAALPTSEELAEQRYRNSMALHAKLLCSGVFISKRAPQEVIEHDLKWKEWYFHDWSKTQWAVDREKQRVTLWAPRNGAYRATPRYISVHTPTLGCSLLPVGAERTAFEPADAGTRLAPAEQMDWPMGDRNAEGATADRGKMEAVLDLAFDDTRQSVPLNTRALLVLHRGRIVAERYAPGFSREMPLHGWSMGKSVAAVLFGVLSRRPGSTSTHRRRSRNGAHRVTRAPELPHATS